MRLPNEITVIKEYNKLYFNKNYGESHSYDFELSDKTVLGDYIFLFRETDNTSNNVIRFNSIKLPLRVITIQNADKMRVKNLNGSKKINDIFIDNKVPLSKRNKWPIVVDANNTILWLPALKKSEFDIPKGSNYDIIIEYLKKGEKDYE